MNIANPWEGSTPDTYFPEPDLCEFCGGVWDACECERCPTCMEVCSELPCESPLGEFICWECYTSPDWGEDWGHDR